MYVLEYYKQLREDSIKVHNDTMKLYQQFYMIPALHTMQVVEDNTIMLESENEENALKDFSIYGHRVSGNTAIERYANEQVKHITPRMEEFVKVATKNVASFFEIEHVDKEDGTINLVGVIGNEKGKKYCISDWGFSQIARPNLLIYIRFIPFPDSFQEKDYYGNIGMTSGLHYIFDKKDQQKIFDEGQILDDKFKIADPMISRQVIFFHLNRKFGLTNEEI